MKTIPTGRSVCLAAEVTSPNLTKAQNGGWTFEALGQIYKKPNQHLMYFFPNSGARTIQQRVPSKSIKIHDGHPAGLDTDASVSHTLGFVAAAEEKQSGMRYTGFLSSTEPEIADKLSDGTITENSMELKVMEGVPKSVPVESVPEVSRGFASLNSKGEAVMLGVRQYMWRHVGLVSGSSQDMPAILSPPSMVALAGLPVTTGEWNPAAASDRLSDWAGTITLAGAETVPNYVKLASGYLAQFADDAGDFVLAGQIATPDADGHLVVNAAAIPAALEDLRQQLERSSLGAVAKSQMLDCAYRRIGPYLLEAAKPLTASSQPVTTVEGAADTAPANLSSTATATAAETPEPDASAASQDALGSPQAPTAGSEEDDSWMLSARIAHLGLDLEINQLLAQTRGVADEPTGTSRRTGAEGEAGRRGMPASSRRA